MFVIQPFGRVDDGVLQAIVDGLAFQGEARVMAPIAVPRFSYNEERGQYLVDRFMEALDGVAGVEAAEEETVVGVVDEDLYTPSLNFIFGQARVEGRICIIAIERLRTGADRPTLHRRVMKEAVHEVGHTLGLRHCPDPECVMHFSNTLMDTDVKGARFCGICQARLDR